MAPGILLTMALAPGTRFGSYEVVEPIGSGGMGEVWRATDTRLKRDVALKVLPQAFVEDADRLARFRREAEILASLNHPNIATIHGLEKLDEQMVIVMELVAGPTLADRIAEGPIPVDEALAIARQIADALEAAHARQIVHRDLKPANIKLRDDGAVKVLDFGISKPIDPAAISGAAPVATTPAMTETGIILGTAAYMSPEQARGRFVDQRTDIWAFGCLLFEMLTGQPAFGGDDVVATLARILERETDLSSMPGTISPAVSRTIGLCLEKDPRNRIADIRDVRLALEGRFQADLLRSSSHVATTSFSQRALPIVAAATLSGLIVTLIAWSLQSPEAEYALNRFVHQLPPGNGFPAGVQRVLDISRDSRSFVYQTGQTGGHFLRRMNELAPQRINGAIGADPMLSPDGAFVATAIPWEGRLVRVPVGGGQQTLIVEFDNYPSGFYWADDNSIWYPQSDGIWQVSSAGGGVPSIRISAETGERIYRPQPIPELNAVLFTSLSGGGSNWDAARIYLASIETGDRMLLVDGGSDGRLLASGHLAYTVGNKIFAYGFDPDSAPFVGGGALVMEDVMRSAQSPGSQYAVSDDGTLVYVPAASEVVQRSTLVWVDRDGKESDFGLDQQFNIPYVRISPDGQQVAATLLNPDPALYVTSVTQPFFRQVANSPATEFPAIWEAGSQSLIYNTIGTGPPHVIYRARIDRIAEPEVLAAIDTTFLSVEALIDDGNQLVFTLDAGRRDPPDIDESLAVLNLRESNGDREWEGLIDRDSDDSMATVSPDGEWIVYQSEERDGCGIYIEWLEDLGNRRLVSNADGGWGPGWSPSGDEIYYRRLGDGAMMAASFDATPGLRINDRVGTATVAFENQGYGTVGVCSARTWDMGPDGRFLMIKRQDVAVAAGVVIVQNWFPELERLVPIQ